MIAHNAAIAPCLRAEAKRSRRFLSEGAGLVFPAVHRLASVRLTNSLSYLQIDEPLRLSPGGYEPTVAAPLRRLSSVVTGQKKGARQAWGA